ncbi:FeoB-associated Cys-rich membrane protein [Deferribacter desulfuricans]|nr:FeoB-associated Cys-rich membrane protein [Deferribacter desulfuricans]
MIDFIIFVVIVTFVFFIFILFMKNKNKDGCCSHTGGSCSCNKD